MPQVLRQGLVCFALALAAFPQESHAQTEPSAAAPSPAPDGDEESEIAALDESTTGALVLAAAVERELKYPRLELYGFADFTATQLFLSDESIWAARLPTNPTFALGNLNLYVDSTLSRRLRSLFEVRFSLLPIGSKSVDPSTGALNFVDTTVEDYTRFARPTQWSGIVLERAYLAYTFHPAFELTIGRYITPWGIWNVDHGSPVVIGVLAPFITIQQLIPRIQTGLQASGRWHWPNVRFAYHLTLSNGRGPADSLLDFDNNKAVGSRFVFSTSEAGELAVGATFYYGRYTNPTLRFVRSDPGGTNARVETVSRIQYDELSVAGDVRWEFRSWLIVAEVTARAQRFTEAGRPMAQNSAGGLIPTDGRPQLEPDDIQWGAYVLAGYRFRWLGIMPFVHLDYYNDTDFIVSNSLFTHIGLNIRPEPYLVVKFQYSMANLIAARPLLIGTDPRIQGLLMQVAWAF